MHADHEVPRDRWGRPLIIPPGGGTPAPYARVSTLAKALDDTSNLTAWRGRMVALGMALEPSLVDRAVAVANRCTDPVRDGKRDLDAVVRSATERAGASTAADTGTALHELTEVLDRGDALRVIPERWMGHLDAYQRATACLDVLDIETFVVNDAVTAAGTFDRLVRLPDGRVVVADYKTGRHDASYPSGVTTQIATYARGHRYDPATGTRSPIHPDLVASTGLLIHQPASGDGTCRLYLLDLTVGWEQARMAAEVARIRKRKPADYLEEMHA